jgi:hypothetical protein
MMSFSEDLLVHLKTIADADRINIFEAAAQYCESHDIDADELIESLDAGAVAQIKAAALQGNHVRKCVHKKPNALF